MLYHSTVLLLLIASVLIYGRNVIHHHGYVNPLLLYLLLSQECINVLFIVKGKKSLLLLM